MIDILAISHACLTAVNRVIYREFLKNGWSVQLVIPQELAVGEKIKTAEPDGPSDPIIHRLPLSGLYSRFWKYDGLRELLERLQPRIILAESEPGTLIALEAGRWARNNNANLVCQSCENMMRGYGSYFVNGNMKGLLSNMVARSLTKLASPRIDHIFVISSDGKKVMEWLGFQERVSQIPLGYDPHLFYLDQNIREETRQRLGLHELTFAVFGRMVHEKGIHLLIEALEAFKNKSWQLLLDRFELFHNNDYSQYVKTMIREKGLESRVVYFDASHAEMPAYMMAADVVVAPSILTPKFKEQYGRVVPEAMACGRFVMVSRNGAMPELLGETGVIFPPNDVHSLVASIERVFDQPSLLQKLGPEAARRAARHLSIPKQFELMASVFQQLSRSSGPQSSDQKKPEISARLEKERIPE